MAKRASEGNKEQNSPYEKLAPSILNEAIAQNDLFDLEVRKRRLARRVFSKEKIVAIEFQADLDDIFDDPELRSDEKLPALRALFEAYSHKSDLMYLDKVEAFRERLVEGEFIIPTDGYVEVIGKSDTENTPPLVVPVISLHEHRDRLLDVEWEVFVEKKSRRIRVDEQTLIGRDVIETSLTNRYRRLENISDMPHDTSDYTRRIKDQLIEAWGEYEKIGLMDIALEYKRKAMNYIYAIIEGEIHEATDINTVYLIYDLSTLSRYEPSLYEKIRARISNELQAETLKKHERPVLASLVSVAKEVTSKQSAYSLFDTVSDDEIASLRGELINSFPTSK
jgi:hypothetical protein